MRNNQRRHYHDRRRDKRENTPAPEATAEKVTEKETEEASPFPTASTPAAEKAPDVEVVGVSFRSAGKKYYFAPGRLTLHMGDEVIVETARGMEFGRITIPNRTVPASAITPPLRLVTRLATDLDRERNARNRELEGDAIRICREKIEQHKLEMSLVGAEYTFDNSKLLFYFTAEGRVDFRELVKDLASVFHTRIELRQIGIRDEAKLLGGIGACGRPFCCATFLPDFVQVSIKMAKEQNFSLNSAKISGACGRLMCCLRYEHESYEEALKTTPPNGALVDTPNGQGVVIETRPLLQLVKVRLEEKPEAPRLFSCEEVTVLRNKAPKPQAQGAAPAAEKNVERNTEKTAEKATEGTAENREGKPMREERSGRRSGGRHGRRHHEKQENS